MPSKMNKILRVFVMLTGMSAGVAMALPLDDVTLEYQSEGVVATIQMSVPIQFVQYKRSSPGNSGKTLEIFYTKGTGAPSTELWVDNEVRNSPPSSLIPAFTVTTRDQATNPKLVVEFVREAEFSVAQGKDGRSFVITIRPDRQNVSAVALPNLPVIKPEVIVPAGTVLAGAEANAAANNTQGRALMVQAKDALAAKNNEAAVGLLNQLLLLPPNDYTQDAQEWVGVARQRAGQFDKAKTEYDLYLNLYPKSEGVPRVMQRLVQLSGKGGEAGIVDVADKKRAARWTTFGSLSSRYYFGKTTQDSTQTFNGVPETITTSFTDQSMLITTEDVSGRYTSEDVDGRLVFRAMNTSNFLSNKPSINRISSMYGEIKGRKQDYLVRVGRQSSNGGGVMGRFDGLAGSYGDAQELRINGAVGAIADYSQTTQPVFVSASVDRGAFSIYGINQTMEGAQDRRAVGTEWRYFEDKKTAFALLDYDVNFNQLNAAQVMGSMGVGDISFNFMADRRKTPSLSIRNALLGAETTSINALMQSMSASSLRDLALARTATSTLVQLGATMPFNKKWQIGADVRVSKTTTVAASGTFAGIPTRGGEVSATTQLIGSSLWREGDIWSASTSYNYSKAADGYSLFLYNHQLFNGGWMMDTSMQMYSQKDQFGGVVTRFSPTVRGSYRFQENITFDLDVGVENTKSSGASGSTKAMRYFTSAGVRWDF
ncbi:MAG: tetratricopeptide repeat protein [Sideroxydans sp.]|nr:tetratricopeptide repeat protein [Sideroxydans sp.]